MVQEAIMSEIYTYKVLLINFMLFTDEILRNDKTSIKLISNTTGYIKVLIYCLLLNDKDIEEIIQNNQELKLTTE